MLFLSLSTAMHARYIALNNSIWGHRPTLLSLYSSSFLAPTGISRMRQASHRVESYVWPTLLLLFLWAVHVCSSERFFNPHQRFLNPCGWQWTTVMCSAHLNCQSIFYSALSFWVCRDLQDILVVQHLRSSSGSHLPNNVSHLFVIDAIFVISLYLHVTLSWAFQTCPAYSVRSTATHSKAFHVVVGVIWDPQIII